MSIPTSWAKAIDKIIEDNPHVKAGDPHMPPCTPVRQKTPLTGANLVYPCSTEPDTILVDVELPQYYWILPAKKEVGATND